MGIQTSPQKVFGCMGVSKNNGTPKSSILIGFFIINHPFWGTTIFGNIRIGFIRMSGIFIFLPVCI